MNTQTAKMHRSIPNLAKAAARKRKQRRAAWAAFVWHVAEFALVAALIFDRPSALIAVLLAVSLVGVGWSLWHLPGRTA